MSKLNEAFLEKYGPWAVVTGASAGIGRAFAFSLAEEGLNLVLLARRRDELEVVARECAEAFGTECRIVVSDLADGNGMKDLLPVVEDLEVGMLVAAAGVGTSGLFVDGDFNSERSMLRVNCEAVLEQVHFFSKRFRSFGRGGP